MKQTIHKKLHPLSSVLKTLGNAIVFRIHFPWTYNGRKMQMSDGVQFEIFRHVVVGSQSTLSNESGAVFIVRFKLSNMSVEKNIKFSRFPIPMFIGLPGFRAKFWCLNRDTGYNQGIYQWKSEEDAMNYSQSFAMKFMAKRSELDSISFEIIPNTNIYEVFRQLELRSES